MAFFEMNAPVSTDLLKIPLRRCRRRRPATETGVSGRPIVVSSSFLN